MNEKDIKYCTGCDHFKKSSGILMCDYLLDTGTRRPCSAGAGCSCHTGFQRKKLSVRLDARRAGEMYYAGKTDDQIAKAMGVAESTVQAWRRKHGYRPNRKTNAGGNTMSKEQKKTDDGQIPGQDEQKESANEQIVSQTVQEMELIEIDTLIKLLERCAKAGLGEAGILIDGKPVTDFASINIKPSGGKPVIDFITQ